MIIQGTNSPIIFTFSETMTGILDIEISLYSDEDVELKHWTLTDVTISGKTVAAPLTQIETIRFPAGKCHIELKWMDASKQVNFAKNIQNVIMERKDKTIMNGAD